MQAEAGVGRGDEVSSGRGFPTMDHDHPGLTQGQGREGGHLHCPGFYPNLPHL